MRLSDGAVAYLREKSTRELARRIHPEDLTIYNIGLEDGVTILAKEILEQLKPEEPVIEKESE